MGHEAGAGLGGGDGRVLAAFGCLSGALVVLIGQPDEVEEMVRRHGPVTKRYYPDPDEFVGIETDISAQEPTDTDIYRELSRAGWIESSPHQVVLQPADGTFKTLMLVPTERGVMHVVYHRRPTRAERLMHRITAALRIED
jgi:hypothetical protein